jgi:exopolyphosphatase/guanosine-5'-triphosphate,3'-diphosphate pyrophosphatase
MIVGELRHGQLVIIDRLKETVRLSEDLDKTGELGSAARERAVDCLMRFGERLRDIDAANIRAAGTSTFRRARDNHAFFKDAEQALGHPIEIISGREEARLIYLGVAHNTPPCEGPRLVLDIGGGSTELILGQGDQPQSLESLNMGCVTMTERFFKGGAISKAAFERARLAVKLKIRPVKAFFRDLIENEVIGTSGTVLATEEVARQLGLIESGLTLDAVEQLIERHCEFDRIENLSFRGLSDRRAEVWAGGLAILVELMVALRIDKLHTSDGALREGLLYESLGRLQHEDARERSVQALALRYNVDHDQAVRVAATAADLLQQCDEHWELTAPLAHDVLQWSAHLHEIGLDISHDGFERHGAYIAQNAELPGFPLAEQRFLAFLVANQRRHIKIRSSDALPASWRSSAERLSILLRLAVLLNRSRSRDALPRIEFRVADHSIELRFDECWLRDNPLTKADLERESRYLAEVGYALSAC